MINNEIDLKNYILNFYEASINSMKTRVGIYCLIVICLFGVNTFIQNIYSNTVVLIFSMMIITVISIDSYLFLKRVKLYRNFLKEISSENYNSVWKEFNQDKILMKNNRFINRQ